MASVMALWRTCQGGVGGLGQAGTGPAQIAGVEFNSPCGVGVAPSKVG